MYPTSPSLQSAELRRAEVKRQTRASLTGNNHAIWVIVRPKVSVATPVPDSTAYSTTRFIERAQREAVAEKRVAVYERDVIEDHGLGDGILELKAVARPSFLGNDQSDAAAVGRLLECLFEGAAWLESCLRAGADVDFAHDKDGEVAFVVHDGAAEGLSGSELERRRWGCSGEGAC